MVNTQVQHYFQGTNGHLVQTISSTGITLDMNNFILEGNSEEHKFLNQISSGTSVVPYQRRWNFGQTISKGKQNYHRRRARSNHLPGEQ